MPNTWGGGAPRSLTLAEQAAGERIVRALGYHTLAVKLAAALAQDRDLATVAGDYEANPALGTHIKEGDEAVEVALSSSVAALPPLARRLFAALAAFATEDVGRRAVAWRWRATWRRRRKRRAAGGSIVSTGDAGR